MIPFNKVSFSDQGRANVAEVLAHGELASRMKFSMLCEEWFEQQYHVPRALLTHSATHALHLATLCCDLRPGDEVIMPSYTFVTVAQMFVLRGAVPVFIDIRPDDLNMDASRIEAAVTEKTKAICPMHYAGTPCAMDEIMSVADQYHLDILEDAAHAILCRRGDNYLGTEGRFGFISFHETKNISSGDGGLLLVNRAEDADRAEVIRDKGTNRGKFSRGLVDKYTWTDVGMSYRPSDLQPALLWSQLLEADEIMRRRVTIWEGYHAVFRELVQKYPVRFPVAPQNAHVYYCIFSERSIRDHFIALLKEAGISAVTHYEPLHQSPMGMRYGRTSGDLPETAAVSNGLVRLPLWPGLEEHQEYIIEVVVKAMEVVHR